MKKKIVLRVLSPTSVTIFKIQNRRGYAAFCKGNLTEGRTPYQAYLRMNKALKRKGYTLKNITSLKAQKLVKK